MILQVTEWFSLFYLGWLAHRAVVDFRTNWPIHQFLQSFCVYRIFLSGLYCPVMNTYKTYNIIYIYIIYIYIYIVWLNWFICMLFYRKWWIIRWVSQHPTSRCYPRGGPLLRSNRPSKSLWWPGDPQKEIAWRKGWSNEVEENHFAPTGGVRWLTSWLFFGSHIFCLNNLLSLNLPSLKLTKKAFLKMDEHGRQSGFLLGFAIFSGGPNSLFISGRVSCEVPKKLPKWRPQKVGIENLRMPTV